MPSFSDPTTDRLSGFTVRSRRLGLPAQPGVQIGGDLRDRSVDEGDVEHQHRGRWAGHDQHWLEE
jgi:hypothetical protein